MRYNFVQTVSLMTPCFSGRMKHTILIKEGDWIKAEFWSKGKENQQMDAAYPEVGNDGIFWHPRGFSVFDKHGKSKKKYRSGIKPRIFRTPTPWHKYQYRPAKKERNLKVYTKKDTKPLLRDFKLPKIDWVEASRLCRIPLNSLIGLPKSLGRPMNPKVGI